MDSTLEDLKNLEPSERKKLKDLAWKQQKQLRRSYGHEFLRCFDPEFLSERLADCMNSEDDRVKLRAIKFIMNNLEGWIQMAGGNRPDIEQAQPEPISEEVMEAAESVFGPPASSNNGVESS